MTESLPPTAARRIEITIPGGSAGDRLDQALAALLHEHSRSQIQKFIKAGLVSLDGAPATRVSEPVAGGTHVCIDVPEPVASTVEAQSLLLQIVYEDATIVVVDKAAGVVVHPAAGHSSGTLVNALLHHVGGLSGIGGERRPGIVHRLDKGTSGLMVVAKHDAAHQELRRQFSSREVEKAYVALVWGALEGGRQIDLAIGRDPRDRQRMSVRARRARSAVTVITATERLRGVTLTHMTIGTGRTHQIRVHLQAIGHPVVGDVVYGGVRKPLPADLRVLGSLDRPFLHASHLAFVHPVDGRRLAFDAPLPPDLQRVLDTLRLQRSRPEP